MQKYKQEIRTKFKFYSQDLLNNLFRHPYTKIEFLERDLKISRLTAAKYLDELSTSGKKFDVICVDPPAFAKKIADKKNALMGYQKIFDRVFDIINSGGFLAACSCTYAVNFEDLDMVVQKAASKKKRKIKLIDIGLQGPDHPISGLSDKANYLKYLAYWIE